MVLPCIIGAVKRIVESCAGPAVGFIKTEVGHLLNYSANLEKLRKEVENLSDAATSVQNLIEEAENNRGETVVDAVVDRWLSRTTSLKEEASKIVNDEDRSETERCLMGLRPNLWACYLVSKSANRVIDEAVELQDVGTRFDRVANIDYSRCSGVTPIPDFEEFESRDQVSSDIVAALKDSSVNMVGVYGMGGVGKTTLVEKVGAQLQKERTFNFVVMAVVSHKPDLKRIQGEIAEALKIKLDAETEKGRALQLKERLEKREKGLIILDDIWERIELKDIGIPFAFGKGLQLKEKGGPADGGGDDTKKGFTSTGCKILMTSRSEKVLRNEMGSTSTFPLQVLSDADAWNLFEKSLGGTAPQDPTWLSIATQVVERCSGVPVLLVIVSRTLKDGDLQTWKNALEQLKTFDRHELVDQVYLKIELSYNHLKGEEIKSLFRLCAQTNPGYIVVKDLLTYAMGLRLFKSCNRLETSRDRLHKYLNDLKAFGLLQDYNSEGTAVRMHDIVHKFAAFVGSRDHRMFTVTTGNKLEEWPTEDELEQFTAISMPYCHLPSELPVAFNNPKLESFIMARNEGDSPLKIPDNFFVRTKGLKLIDLGRMSLSPVLPSSISVLVKLQTLFLYFCELDDISIIGELSTLQVLSLKGSTVVHLPKELGKLTRLKLLDLSDCSSLRRIASDVLSKLTSLEELSMENSFNHWEEEGCGSSGETTQNASLGELKNLLNLIDLDIHTPHAEMFPKGLLVFEKLERFRIFIGEEWKWDDDYRASRTLKLKHTGSGQLEYGGIKALMGRAEAVYLQQLDGFISLCELDLDSQGFPHMKYLDVQNGVQIQYIVNSFSRCIVFPNLKSLLLKNLTKLEKICHGGGQLAISGSFKNLSIIKVERCDALKDLFSSSLARGLLCLKEIGVINCQNMETIVSQENHQSRANNQDHEDVEFVELRALTLEDLPHLLNFYSILTKPIIASPAAGTNEIVYQKNQLITPTPLLHKKVVFPKLEELRLLRIRVEKIWDVDNLAIAAEGWRSCFQNLTSFILDGCRNITYLLTSSMVKSLLQLKKLEVSDCKSMKEIVFTGTGEKMLGEIMSFPKLNFIKLKSLPKLKRFCNAEIIKCPSLQRIWIQDCVDLGTFTTNYGTTDLESNTTLFDEKVAFPNLEELTLEKNIDSVKKIWGNELYPNSFSKLKTLKIEGGGALLNIFPSIMLRNGLLNLENLAVSHCNSFEEVFDVKKLSMNEKEGQGALPPTKLTTITIQNLPKLKQVWNKDPHGLTSFQNLGSVHVEECPSLTSLFPISVALGLHQLEELSIKSCEVMEEIVSMDEESDQLEAAPNFMLPKVTSLHLKSLPELKRFYTGAHTSEWPALKTFWMWNCDKVDMFVPNEFKSIQEEACIHRVSQVDLQPFISFSKIIPNLEEVSLRNKDIEMICDHDLFMPPNKLKNLQLKCFHAGSENFPVALIGRFLNLEQLVVACSNFKQLFPSQLLSDETHVKTLARIPQLRLDLLREMTHIWGEESQLDQILPYLKSLEVWSCDRLMNLAPSNAALFPNLTYLDVWKCKELVKLLTFSTTNSLEQLTYARIRECDSLKEIVVKDEGETTSNIEDTIVFPKLERITLQSLTSLTSFCSAANCIFKFPSFVSIIIAECPKMEFFSHGVLTTPELNRVWVKKEGEEEDEGRWEGNLNSTIRQMYKEMVGFSGRKHLKLAEFPLLKDMWLDEHPLEHFSDLQFLEVEQCTFVSYVISSGLLFFLNNLEELRVADCNSLEEVFDGYSKELELRNNNINVGLLSKFNKFYLSNLPSLRHVWPENFERILDLRNLTLLNICNCSSLRYVFTPSVALCLVQLQEMQVKNCVRMEAVIINREKGEGMRDDNILIFPQLNSILLESLPCLESFYSGNGVLKCPYLEKITMIDCPKLETFTSTSLREKDLTTIEANDERLGNKDLHTLNKALFNDKVAFPNLEELQITEMNGLKRIWQDELYPSSFLKLKTLKIENGRALLTIFPSGLMRRALNLESVIISNCESVVELFGVQMLVKESKLHGEVQETQLRTLHISELPKLKHVWSEDPHGLVSFQNLRSVNVEECPSLTSLFPISVALGLQQLEELQIQRCEGMEEIVSNTNIEAGHQKESCEPEFVFPKVTFLKLWRSPELKRFYPGVHTSEWPILNDLSIYHCDKIDLFGPQFQSIRVEGCKEEQLGIQVHEQPFISLTKIIPNLEEVSLRPKDVNMIYDGVCLVLTDKVKMIDLQCFHDDSHVFPIELLQRFQNLNKLVVSCSDFKQLFTSELLADETNVKILSRIPQLRVDLLPEMTHIWDEEADKLYQILQNLEHLEVLDCNRLINLAPSTALFPNLTYLEVEGCEQLIKLVTPSTAKSFVQLTEMRISNCDSLTVIVAIDGEDTSDKDIVFGKLETLALQSLTSLTSFCSTTNCNFQFPSLVEVIVAECTEMEFFSKGALSTPKLSGVWVKKDDEEEEEGRWEGELDSTLRLMYEEMVGAVDKDDDDDDNNDDDDDDEE